MTDDNGHNEYIKCNSCKCKYINDEEHLKTDFGYNRLGKMYKSCVKCRQRWKDYYKANASAISDYNRNRYCELCEICNHKVYKYQMQRHLEVCQAYHTQHVNNTSID